MPKKEQPMPPTPSNRIRGKVTRMNNIKIIRVTRVHRLIYLRETSLIPQPNNMVNIGRRKRLFICTNLAPIAIYMGIILMSVPFYLICIKHG